MNTETRICQSCRKEFAIEPDDFSFYESIHVLPPTWCPECRVKRRLNWQGYRILYKRKCEPAGEMVISTHHPELPHSIYRQDVWWGDSWDPKSYGKDIDWGQPFLTQFGELMKEVPLPALYTSHSTLVNSEYNNAASDLKNCYLCFRITGGENCAYLNTIVDAKECLDCSFLNQSELCYGSVRVNKCYQTFFSEDCEDCRDIWFSKDCIGCSDCFGCINLRGKQYHVYNQPYSKEEYLRFMEGVNTGGAAFLKGYAQKSEEVALKAPRRQFHGRKNTDVTGDYISNSKNVHDSYLFNNGENLRFCQFLKNGPSSNSYDWSFFGDVGEWIYECCWTGLKSHNCKFSSWLYGASDLEYCFGCHNSQNLFGCSGIRKGEYCILNKQYSKEEYFTLVAKIKKHMADMPFTDSLGRTYRYGEMLPPELSPWAYNESSAYEWFPLKKEQATAQGFLWREEDGREYREPTISLPEHIKDTDDMVLKAILKCDGVLPSGEACGKNYQIIPMELQFLRRFNLPVPRQCPLCRDRARIRQLNPMQIYTRKCAKCGKEIQTSYAPERPEIVYCESCYQQEVV